MNPNIERVKEIFDKARVLESPKERADFVAKECGVDELLRAEVERLLRAREGVGAFLETPILEGGRGLISEMWGMFVEGDSTTQNNTELAIAGWTPSPQTKRPLREGDRFGNFRIFKHLGSGGMGEVYEAEHLEDGRIVAIKLLRSTLADESDRARFLREGQLAASVNHPNSVYIYGTEEIEGIPVISMELVRGSTLEGRVKKSGPLPPPEAVRIVLQIVEGLEAAASAGIQHRDVKPSNCFLEPDGTAKIGDFGLAISTLAADTNVTEEGKIWFSPGFASPEQIRGDALDMRSDIFSVGATLYFLLSGEIPFKERHDPVRLCREIDSGPPQFPDGMKWAIPRGLARLVLRCLAAKPEQRFNNYAELRRQLLPFAAGSERPGELHARFLAGVIDNCVLFAIGTVFAAVGLILVPPVIHLRVQSMGPRWLIIAGFLLTVLYYAISEGKWGATIGKRICGLRVVRMNGTVINLEDALFRAVLFNAGPFIGSLATDFLGEAPSHNRKAGLEMLRSPYLWSTALLFITARRRNGFAALHDIFSQTKVVERKSFEPRPKETAPTQSPEILNRPTVGPYYVLQTLFETSSANLLLAFDERLKRQVWIRMTTAVTAPIPRARCELARTGRLRWLAGQRTENTSWDAYEAPPGKPLRDFLERPQPWSLFRYWLVDLIKELVLSLKESSLPPLSMDRIWVTADNRIKLLEFPIYAESESTFRTETTSASNFSEVKSFLLQFAAICLQGRDKFTATVSKDLWFQIPLPQHARRFLEGLQTANTPDALLLDTEPLLQRVVAISRQKRSAVLLLNGFVLLPYTVLVTLFLIADDNSDPVGKCLWAFLIGCCLFLGTFSWEWSWTWNREGGLFYRGLGIQIVREDGLRARESLINLRRFVTWLPILVVGCIWTILTISCPDGDSLSWFIGKLLMSSLLLVFVAGVIWSLITPDRTCADRIVGTHLVPK